MTTKRAPRPIPLLILAAALCILCADAARAQRQSPDKLWTEEEKIKVDDVTRLSSLAVAPGLIEAFRLDKKKLDRALQQAGAQLSSAVGCDGEVISLPMPGNIPGKRYPRFCVQESPIMEPELAAEFPEIKTYQGQGIDDPTMTVRFDRTPTGLHAIVLTPDRTFYIDPLSLSDDDDTSHLSYFQKDAEPKLFQCLVRTETEAPARRGVGDFTQLPQITNGTVLRTYRLAVAATGEYARQHGRTVAGALAGIVTTINRVNGIYEQELAIRLKLVKDQKKIIYTNASTDPYTNGNIGRMVSENQANLDRLIGSANYDIGHVFGTAGGGLAWPGVVGVAGQKAKGATGMPTPKGDPFDVAYVAHEIGHQFGANHTFNGTLGDCGSGNRYAATAFEPGSGSTIMAYAGICRGQNQEDLTTPAFHAASLYEIVTYVTGDAMRSVGVQTPTNNRPPVVTLPASTPLVPKKTPFVLTAGGSDPDGHSVSYNWEEMDLGKESPPDDDITEERPLFRSLSPSADPWRMFPSPTSLLRGVSALGEMLPTRNRVMNFRVTVRDHRAGGGAFNYGTLQVSVISDSGPFVVTQPAADATWTANSTQTVKWDPAGTSEAPINCHNVRISLSTDGGQTFTVLQASAPNNGSAAVTVPNVSTEKARVKVEAIDNIFFNVSAADFKITPAQQ